MSGMDSEDQQLDFWLCMVGIVVLIGVIVFIFTGQIGGTP